jgi:hypothetical protein
MLKMEYTADDPGDMVIEPLLPARDVCSNAASDGYGAGRNNRYINAAALAIYGRSRPPSHHSKPSRLGGYGAVEARAGKFYRCSVAAAIALEPQIRVGLFEGQMCGQSFRPSAADNWQAGKPSQTVEPPAVTVPVTTRLPVTPAPVFGFRILQRRRFGKRVRQRHRACHIQCRNIGRGFVPGISRRRLSKFDLTGLGWPGRGYKCH